MIKLFGKLLIFIFFTITQLNTAFSQDVENIVPYFAYGEGVSLQSRDSLFVMNIRFRMQNRVGLTTHSGENLHIDEVEARIRRLRLRFNGHIYNPRLTYVIQLSFSRGDLGIIEDNVPNIIRDAMVTYRFNDHLALGIGQTKLPGNRQRVNSSGDLQLVDRSIVNAVFNIDRDFGVQAYYRNHFGKFYYVLRGAISSGEGRNSLKSDEGLAYTGRVELLPFGRFTNGGDYFEGDLEREEKPKLSTGFSYSFNQNAIRASGQLGNYLFEPRNLSTYMIDFLFKYSGIAYSMELLRRNTPDPVTHDELNFDNVRYIYTGHGENFQLSYIFPSNYEIIGRYSRVIPDEKIREFEHQTNEYTVGVTKYIKGHRVKLQSDLTYQNEHYFNELSSDINHWRLRFQIELGI